MKTGAIQRHTRVIHCGSVCRGGIRFGAMFATLVLALLAGGSLRACAEETYTAPDGKLTFSFPRRWQADNAGERVRLTAPDGSHYLLLRDTISTLPGDSPAANPELKARALEIVKPLLKDAEFTGAQPLTMDHGLGVVFRFHGSPKSDTGPATAIYLTFFGKHSIVVMPEKSGQSSQSIGLAGIMQSLAFTDELPRAAPRLAPAQRPGAGSTPALTGPGAVSFVSQIAPILKEKCEVCHRSTAPLGGFSVSSYSDLMRGGRHGDLVLAGRPESSALLDYLTGKRDLMPKGGPPLPADQIALIRKWIAEGARQQIGGAAAGPTTTGVAIEDSTRSQFPNGTARQNRFRPGIGAGGLGNGAASPGNRLNRPGIGLASPAAGPQLLEGYSGHLITNDLSFSLRLLMDKSATAVWTLSPGREIRYAGAYVGQDGSYVVTLTQTGSQPADHGRILTIELRPRGSQETGIYGFDGAKPRREVSELELSETRASDKPSRPGVQTRPGAQMRSGGQQNRGRRGK